MGRGAFKYEFDRYGMKVEDSRDIFDESLALLERLLTQSNVTSDTDAYRFAPLTITPRPLQQPLPPVWIAAVTPDAVYHSARRGYEFEAHVRLALRNGCSAVQLEQLVMHLTVYCGVPTGGEAFRIGDRVLREGAASAPSAQ